MIPGVKIIDDILKGLPENARLREQLGELRSQVQVLQSEIEKRDAALAVARAEIERLKPKIEGMDADTSKVLSLFFDAGRDLTIGDVARHLGIHISVAEF